jgi:hypothetical protein
MTEVPTDASLPLALGVAAVLGLRHASDPDHVVAVTSLVTAEDGDARAAVRLGAWWGLGHAAALVAVGVPLILFRAAFPAGLESAAQVGVGAVILFLALQVGAKWFRGDYRVGGHSGAPVPRATAKAVGIGILHGLAGTGAVVVLFIASLPETSQAAAALAVFAPMSIVSMSVVTGAFAWVLTRRAVEPLFRSVLIPLLAIAGIAFGAWYMGWV